MTEHEARTLEIASFRYRIRGIGAALLQIAFESRTGGIMQGHEAALAEFRTANDEAVRRAVLQSQPDGFR